MASSQLSTTGCRAASVLIFSNPNIFSSSIPNSAGELAMKGETGHYYCGQAVLSCPCCDGICGPNHGCNCLPCQVGALTTGQCRNHFLPGPGRSRQQELSNNALISGHDQLVDVVRAAAEDCFGIRPCFYRERARRAGGKCCRDDVVQHASEAEVDGDPAVPHRSWSNCTAGTTTGARAGSPC